MKKHWIVLAVVVLASLASGVASADRIDRREVRQHLRIADGVRSGELTRREAVRLRVGQRHIHRVERRVERDGVVTRREEHRLGRMQNHQSRVIYRLKHNGRVR